ncbi:tumor suppressor candidate 2-like [Mytilus edulis]|uniref:tumor suppressor candidate 2-like n=1 Tax=Mytilus trossulus TaxID=6551 RepID=UPI00300617EB
MGQKVSGLTNKVTRSVSSLFSHSEETQESSLATQRATPFVYKRTSSMFFDEEGDLAHEFYEEVFDAGHSRMKRQYKNLRPQGEVELPYPKLHPDLPIVMCELEAIR